MPCSGTGDAILTLWRRCADILGATRRRRPEPHETRMVKRPPIAVAIARFEDVVSRGLQALIDEDESLVLVAANVPHEQIASALSAYRPDVAILNFGSLTSAAELRELHDAHPRTRIVVLANRPTPAECRQMLAFGATACLAKATQARDILNAIHLASRGLHVMPPAGT